MSADPRLDRYARVCGFHYGQSGPDGGEPMPSTYPHILAFPAALRLMRGRTFPLRLIGLVHIGNVIRSDQPLSTQDKLQFAVRWENLRDHDRGRAVDVITEATVDGLLVWSECSTYLQKSKQPGRGRVVRHGSELVTAQETWTVDPGIARAYARVSGDRNPIHTSTVAARLFGFPGRIAHGMWTLARCLAAMNDQLPARYTVDVSFKLPVVLPARVGFTGGPAGFELRDAGTGRPHLTGQVSG